MNLRRVGHGFDSVWHSIDINDQPYQRSKLLAFRWLLMLDLIIEYFLSTSSLYFMIPVGLCALLMPFPKTTLWSLRIFTLLFLYSCYVDLLVLGNHKYLAALLLVMLSFVDVDNQDDVRLFLNTSCWLTILVFFHTGLAKMWFGQYWDGSFLAHTMIMDSSFRQALQWLLPEAEFARLLSYHALDRPGLGPFAVEDTFFLIFANMGWITELIVAGLLLFKPTRTPGIVIGILSIVMIELIARELIFGIFFVNMVLLFCQYDWNKKFLPLFILLLLYILCSSIGLLPKMNIS